MRLETPAECRQQLIVMAIPFRSLEETVNWFGPDTLGAHLAAKAFAGEPVSGRCGWITSTEEER